MNNRIYKFRAWDKRNEKMIYPDGYEYEIVYRKSEIFLVKIADYNYSEIAIGPVDSIIMQYTGLKDKNNKEIYEGDVVKLQHWDDELKYRPLEALLYIVEFKYGCFGFTPLHPELVHPDDVEWRPFYDSCDKELWNMKYFEVIGNVYELLEER